MNCKYKLCTHFQESFYPKKRESFRLSRTALALLVGPGPLEIEEHFHLKSDSKIKVSISHTKGLGAAMISTAIDVISVGIDVEWADRIYKAEIEKFFKREQDDKTLSLLELWACKEAAYKAFFPLYQEEKPLVLKDFIVKNNKFYLEEMELGPIELREEVHSNKKVVIALAVILKS